MIPAWPQLPPPDAMLSVRVTAGPLGSSKVVNLRCSKNAIFRLSGDQKGRLDSSVPGIGWAGEPLSSRTQREALPVASNAGKTTARPSGEIAAEPFTRKLNCVPLGGAMSETTTEDAAFV